MSTMNDAAKRQFARVDREIDKAVDAIEKRIEGLLDLPRECECVAYDYLVERLWTALARDSALRRTLDHVTFPGPVTLQLQNTLDDYGAQWDRR